MGGIKETGVRVSNFISAKKHVLNTFGIEEDFFIKPLIDKRWEVVPGEDFFVLKYWLNETSVQSFVIVKKDNKPIIVRKNNYTLVVALDCVKVCFIFDNARYDGKISWEC